MQSDSNEHRSITHGEQLSVQQSETSVSTHHNSPQWLHPLSLVFSVLSNARASLVPVLFGGYAAFQGMRFGYLILFLVLLGQTIHSLIQYLSLRFQFKDSDLVINEGLFFRTYRTIPVHRIQNIDLKRNLLHRIFSVAEVRIETASGSEPEAILRVLSLDQVDQLNRSIAFMRLQSDLIEDKSQAQDSLAQSHEQNVDATAEMLLEVEPMDLVYAGLLSNRGAVLIGLVVGFFFQGNWWKDGVALREFYSDFVNAAWIQRLAGESLNLAIAVLVALVFGLLVIKVFSVAWYLIRFFGYRLSLDGDSLHIQCGMFTQLSATIPRKRIQLISIQQTLMQRWFGLAAIRIETAGGAGTSDDATTSVGRRWFVPIIRDSQLREFLPKLKTSLEWDLTLLPWRSLEPDAERRMRRLNLAAALLISICIGIAVRPWGFLVLFALMPVAIWRAREQARSMRYARLGNQVFYRSGVLTKKRTVTFLDKTQTVSIYQSPFDRRWKMATLAIDTAGAGPANHRVAVEMLSEDFAHQEFLDLSREASHRQLQWS